ncbi:MAG: SUMF1/EgtB/PvdO family nonheme iron enzyme [Spirochaetia bacterium]|nr:SUMF1/EgtB/PvdO family nonheme iron enzyme [Spirochaetia bacterium]
MKNISLKPLWGIRPGLYILIGLVLIICIILFLLLVLPGMRNNGTYMSFTSEPVNSAVYIDDVFVGSTPCTVFVEKGVHSLRIEKPYFTDLFINEYEIGGRIFGSLFFKKKASKKFSLQLSDPKKYLESRLQELYNYSLINSYSSSYVYPKIGEQILEDLKHIPETFTTDLWRAFISFFPYLASSEEIAADLQNLLNNKEIQRSSGSGSQYILEQLNAIEKRITDNSIPENNLPDEENNFSQDENEKDNNTDLYFTELNLLFTNINSGEFIYGDTDFSASSALYSYPVKVYHEDFYILKSVVTQKMYSDFLEENPEWLASNKSELIASGLVDDQYLQDFFSESSKPVTYVSQFAASAYCEWLTSIVQEKYPEYSVVLPQFSQWEKSASFFGTGQRSNETFFYNVWQWTNSIFYPSSPFSQDTDFSQAAENVFDLHGQFIVKGGSEIDKKGTVFPYTNGSLPPETCSPVVGFRPIIIKDK